jgi:diguanylate cyclase (GGDEF)-like protein
MLAGAGAVTVSRTALVNAVVAAFAAVGVLVALAPASGLRSAAAQALAFAAPAAALLTLAAAARALPRGARAPWLLLVAAAFAAVAAEFQMVVAGGAVQPWAAGGGGLTGSIVLTTSLVLFVVAAARMLYQQDSGGAAEIALDVSLLGGAVLLALVAWSPAVPDSAAELPAYVAAAAAAGALLLGAVLVMALRGPAARALGAGALGLGVAIAPLAAGRACCAAGSASGLAFTLGWIAVAYAGLCVRSDGVALRGAALPAGMHRLRMAIAVLVVLVFAALAVRGRAGVPVSGAVLTGAGVLGVLVTLRSAVLLHNVRGRAAERRQLAQSRALIEVSQALSRMTNLQDTLDVVTEWAARVLGARASMIELLTDDGASLEFHAVHGMPKEVVGLRFDVAGTFTGWAVEHGATRVTADASTDPYISAGVLPYLRNGAVAAAPLRYQDKTLGALSCVGRKPFSDADLEMLRALADQAAVAIENARLFEQVHQLSLTDPLTGLSNRRQLEKDLGREFAAAQRGRRLVAVMFDLNGFKEFNDRYGHLAGDDALRQFAVALAGETRAMNIAARYGGDEFIALLTDSDRHGAATFVERVRQRFPGPHANERDAGLSVAAGYAEYEIEMDSPDELVAAADRALYAEKAGTGRGAVVYARARR